MCDSSEEADYRLLRIEARREHVAHRRARALAQTAAKALVPCDHHLIRKQRHKNRALLIMASVEAQLALSKETNLIDAFAKLYAQRESYARTRAWHEQAANESFSKIFDINYTLRSTPNNEPFDDVSPTFPLRPVSRMPYWTPTWRKIAPVVATDGSLPVGGVPVTWLDHAPEHLVSLPERRRYASISAILFARRFPLESRFIGGPTKAFLLMRTTSGESAAARYDAPVPQKAIRGRRYGANRDRPRTKPQRPAPVYRHYDYDSASQASYDDYYGYEDSYSSTSDTYSSFDPQVTDTTVKKKKKSKLEKNAPAPYIDYDDPTLPTEEDIKEQEHIEWQARYLRGETLYSTWMGEKSLSAALSSSLFFDESTTPIQPSSRQQLACATPAYSDNLYFSTESLSRSASSTASSNLQNSSYTSQNSQADIYFSEESFSLSQSTQLAPHEWESAVSSCDESIYFQEHDLNMSSSQYEWSRDLDLYEDENDRIFITDIPGATPLSENLSSSFLTSNIGDTSDSCGDAETDSQKMTQSCEQTPIDISIYGNPSFALEFVQ